LASARELGVRLDAAEGEQDLASRILAVAARGFPHSLDGTRVDR
jgi:hypothetical protein